MKVQVAGPEHVYHLWDEIKGFIQYSINAAGGEFTLDQAKLLLTSGKWQLIVFVEDSGDIRGAATVRYDNRPNDRVGFVTSMGGRGIIETDSCYEQFMAILKGNGATLMEGACRPSAARLFMQKWRATEKCIVVEVEL